MTERRTLLPAEKKEVTLEEIGKNAKAAEPALAELEDGEYRIDTEFRGGTGRSRILSPSTLIVRDRRAWARIRWNSGNYDYMKVGEEIFYPEYEDGCSVFEIPVTVFDQEMEVIGDTTAMSTPHEISYRLTFRLGSAVSGSSPEQQEFQEQPSGEKDASPSVYLLAAGLAAAGAWFFPGRKKSGRRRRGG